MVTDFALPLPRTQEEQQNWLHSIDAVLAGQYKTDIVFTERLKKELPMQLYEVVRNKKQESAVVLAELKKTIAELPVVELRTRFEPTEHLVEVVSAWLRNHSVAAVVALRKDTAIVAGAVVEYEGIHRDYTLGRGKK